MYPSSKSCTPLPEYVPVLTPRKRRRAPGCRWLRVLDRSHGIPAYSQGTNYTASVMVTLPLNFTVTLATSTASIWSVISNAVTKPLALQ